MNEEGDATLFLASEYVIRQVKFQSVRYIKTLL